MSAGAPRERPVKVIYVMGAGHSGSTILGVALGNCRGMFFAGELDEFLARAGVPVLGGLERTRFWGRVRERVPQAGELYGLRAHGLLERSSAMLRVHRRAAARALRPRYRAILAALFAAVAQVADVDYVVDTSHFPLRARELQGTPAIELYVILLVREPQPVIASMTRLISQHEVARRRLKTLRANAELSLTYALSLAVFRRQPAERRILVHYEDLVAEPERVLTQILARFGSDAPLPDLDALQTGLAIQANRLISSEQVTFKRSPHPDGQPRGGSLVTAVLQRPWRSAFARLRPAASREAGAG